MEQGPCLDYLQRVGRNKECYARWLEAVYQTLQGTETSKEEQETTELQTKVDVVLNLLWCDGANGADNEARNPAEQLDHLLKQTFHPDEEDIFSKLQAMEGSLKRCFCTLICGFHSRKRAALFQQSLWALEVEDYRVISADLTQTSNYLSTATFQPAALWGSYHEDYGEETKTQGSPVGKVERCKLITQSSNSTVFSNHGMELSNQHLRDENETLRQRDLFQVLQLSKESLRADRLSHQVQTLSQWKIRGTELSRAMETLRAEKETQVKQLSASSSTWKQERDDALLRLAELEQLLESMSTDNLSLQRQLKETQLVLTGISEEEARSTDLIQSQKLRILELEWLQKTTMNGQCHDRLAQHPTSIIATLRHELVRKRQQEEKVKTRLQSALEKLRETMEQKRKLELYVKETLCTKGGWTGSQDTM